MKVQWIAVAVAAAVLLIETGCDGTGGMGGQQSGLDIENTSDGSRFAVDA